VKEREQSRHLKIEIPFGRLRAGFHKLRTSSGLLLFTVH